MKKTSGVYPEAFLRRRNVRVVSDGLRCFSVRENQDKENDQTACKTAPKRRKIKTRLFLIRKNNADRKKDKGAAFRRVLGKNTKSADFA